MLYSTLLASASLLAIATASPMADPAEVEKRQWPGKCTIGVEFWTNYVPGGTPLGGGGGNTVLSNGYGFIVGSDGVQTNVDVRHVGDSNDFESTGSYGGIGGGDFKITGWDPKQSNIGDCTVQFKDVTFTKSQVDEGTCDTYKSAKPFSAKSGCRCRFDCQ